MVELMNKALTRAMIAAGDLNRLVKGERGQDLMEYAILGGLIAVVAATAFGGLVFTGALNSMRDTIAGCLDFSGSCG